MCEGSIQNKRHVHKGANLLLKRVNWLYPKLKSEEWCVFHKVMEPILQNRLLRLMEAAEAIRGQTLVHTQIEEHLKLYMILIQR